MKYFIALIFVVAISVTASGQHLVPGNTDVVGLSAESAGSVQLVQSGPNSFFSVGSAYSATLTHPMLGTLSNFTGVYFLNFSDKGIPRSGGFISGSGNLIDAFSYRGGLTIAGRSGADVVANGNVLPIGMAGSMEYLANYDEFGQYKKIVSVWDLGLSQYPNSIATMDDNTGSIYLAGTSAEPYNVAGYGMIGEAWTEYFYLLKFDRNLVLTAVFTAGFDQSFGQSGNYIHSSLTITPDAEGNVLIAGSWDGGGMPVIAGDTLTYLAHDSYGMFAVKLNTALEKVWLQEGVMWGFDQGTGIRKGFAMKNGDLVLTGITTTGYFQLGETEINLQETGYDRSILFAMRIAPDGAVKWRSVIPVMSPYWSGEGFINWEALRWNDSMLYLTGEFREVSFDVAGRLLDMKYYEGIFVAALDMNSGEEQWGYSVSSDNAQIYGVDVDASGNLSMIGRTGAIQEYEVMGAVSVPEVNTLVFNLGLDRNGKPLWYNNAHLQGLGYGLSQGDMVMLRDGEVFALMLKTTSDPLLIGDDTFDPAFATSVILVALNVDNALGGRLLDQQGEPVFPATVIAYKSMVSGAYPLVDSVQVDERGVYLIKGLYPGNYTLIAHPDKKKYPDAIPTYMGGFTSWDLARFLDMLMTTNTSFMDIALTELAKLTPADGSGQMLGNVSYSDEEGGAKGTKGKPYKKASILLVKKAVKKSTQADSLTAFVETDELGDYVFENVPDGAYTLHVDIPGLPMVETYDIVIAGNKMYGLDFEVGDEEIIIIGTVDVEELEALEQADRISIFPNPGNGLLYIDLPVTGDYSIRIYNTVGKLVDSKELLSTAGLFRMDVTGLQEGMYFIDIQGNGGNRVAKYIKK